MLGGRIFISYRRDGAFAFAESVRDRLLQRFPGRVFMDLEDLDPGMPFREILTRELATCEALVALIQRNPEDFRRLHDPSDFVRMELRAALERKIRIFPVLLEGLTPAELLQQPLPDDLVLLREYQTAPLRQEGFHDDLDRLVKSVARALDPNPPQPPASAPAQPLPQPQNQYAAQPSFQPLPFPFQPPALAEMYGFWLVARQGPVPDSRFLQLTIMGFQIGNGVIITAQGAWRYDQASGSLAMWGQSIETGPFGFMARFQGRQGNQYSAVGGDGLTYLFTKQA